MKLHEYQIDDVRRMFDEYAKMLANSRDFENDTRALIKRFVETVEEWTLDDLRERFGSVKRTPVPLTSGQRAAGMRIEEDSNL